MDGADRPVGAGGRESFERAASVIGAMEPGEAGFGSAASTARLPGITRYAASSACIARVGSSSPRFGSITRSGRSRCGSGARSAAPRCPVRCRGGAGIEGDVARHLLFQEAEAAAATQPGAVGGVIDRDEPARRPFRALDSRRLRSRIVVTKWSFPCRLPVLGRIYGSRARSTSCRAREIAPYLKAARQMTETIKKRGRMRRLRNVKIVATLGPSSSDYATIRALFEAGADVFRLNMSHGTHDEQRARYDIIRQIEADTGRPIGVLADLQGPKLRGRHLREWPRIWPRDRSSASTSTRPRATRTASACRTPRSSPRLRSARCCLINDGESAKVDACGAVSPIAR